MNLQTNGRYILSDNPSSYSDCTSTKSNTRQNSCVCVFLSNKWCWWPCVSHVSPASSFCPYDPLPPKQVFFIWKFYNLRKPFKNGSLLKLLSEILCPEFRCGCPPIARSVRSLCPCVGWRTRGARDLGAAGPRAVPGLQSHQSWEGELQWREKAGRPTFCDLQNSKPKSELQPRRTRTQESL